MKKYVITGSIGHISRPIVEGLVKAGKTVEVITSSDERATKIKTLGANALVGTVQDASFIMSTFKNADVVYTMIPPIWQTTNLRSSQEEVARNYANAIRESGVEYVVNLSSIGADVGSGTGPVDGLAFLERQLNDIPRLNVRHLRPAFFFDNFLSQIGLIKSARIMGGNYGTHGKLFLAHTSDIAKAALEELLTLDFRGSTVRYIISDERSGPEIAGVLGKAIGKDLNWVDFTDDQQKQGLLQAGLPETHVENYTTMGKALRDGVMQADAAKNKPAFASTKLEDFAKEFAGAYQA